MRHPHLLVLLLALLAVACQKQRDRNGILSERAMVDVLYDYQLAMALAAEDTPEGKLAETEYRYTQAVFRKHSITDQEFQLSVAHYARDPKTMLDITKRVTRRFEEQGDLAAAIPTPDGQQHDTLVLYRNTGGAVLTANGHNRHTTTIAIPSKPTIDQLLVSFRSRWISREGLKSATVLVTTTFDNDSTARRVEAVREYGTSQGITVPVPPGRKAQTLTLHFLLAAPYSKVQNVVALDDVALRAITTKTKK